eukprot:scaffold14992_cov69-Phaeocystis_antarctica.AAC.3
MAGRATREARSKSPILWRSTGGRAARAAHRARHHRTCATGRALGLIVTLTQGQRHIHVPDPMCPGCRPYAAPSTQAIDR